MYRPWMNRNIGVEMEMNASSTVAGRNVGTTSVSSALRAANVPNVQSMGYGHSDGSSWDVKTDSSCGIEVASPKLLLDENGHNAELRLVCDTLQNVVSPRVDRRCGLHIHVECADFTWRDIQKLIALWSRYEPFFFDLLPDSRLANTYCTPVRAARWTTARAAMRFTTEIEPLLLIDNENEFVRNMQQQFSNRYRSLNLSGFWRHRRIEFRLHSGTIDYAKIRNWSILLLALVNRVKATDTHNAPALARKINQPRPEIGFRVEHVLKVFGLGATSWSEETAVSRDVTRWTLGRHALYGARRNSGARSVNAR